MNLQQTLKQLETQLAELQTEGVTLNQKEKRQIASSLKTDVERDLPKPKQKGFFAKMLDIGKQALPLLLPIIKMIV
jgi:hypothetical protein